MVENKSFIIDSTIIRQIMTDAKDTNVAISSLPDCFNIAQTTAAKIPIAAILKITSISTAYEYALLQQ